MSSDLLRGINAYNNSNSISNNKGIGFDMVQNSNDSNSIFSDMIRGVVSNTSDALKKSERLTAASMVDKAPLHDVILSVNESDIALRSVVSIRDKVITAYQDIIRMPI